MWPPYNLGIVIGVAEDHDTTLCQQMLTAVKCVTDDKFCFQQDSTLAHDACNTMSDCRRVL